MKNTLFISIILFCSTVFFSFSIKNFSNKSKDLVTEKIQKSIDSCFEKGGGQVLLKKGEYLTGTLILKSNVRLVFQKGAILKGSSNYEDYTNDALIFAKDVTNISIEGDGVIDGVDCINPKGEEGFRGPHAIRFINCEGLKIKGITIKNSANWAINCRYCKNGKVIKVAIRGGHDGLHTRFCSNFEVLESDFRTGDDAFAGNDNQDFLIKKCIINTSCNGFRMGCQKMKIINCKLWGPGEYQHKIQKRNNMLAAFVHFSPKDENPKLASGNWVIKNIFVENVDNFYNYNFKDGLWQTDQPLTTISFENIYAKGIQKAFEINGGDDKSLKMSIKNGLFVQRDSLKNIPEKFEGVNFTSKAFFSASNYQTIEMKNTKFEKSGKKQTFNKTFQYSLTQID